MRRLENKLLVNTATIPSTVVPASNTGSHRNPNVPSLALQSGHFIVLILIGFFTGSDIMRIHRSDRHPRQNISYILLIKKGHAVPVGCA